MEREVLQNTNINIRMPKKLKDNFVEITKEKGISYSMVIRKLINYYVNSNGNCEPFSREKENMNG